MDNYLYHHGTKGMKWGRRRYQNPDGTLTDAGKKRYARDAREKDYNKYDESSGTYYKQSKKNGRSDLSADTNRYVTEDMERTKRLADSSRQMSGEVQRMNEKSMRNRPKNKMDLSNMSDKELRDEINRAYLEKQYNDLYAPDNTSRGRERVNNFLEVTGNVLAIGSSALAIALAYRELTGGR